MGAAAIPHDELERLAALDRYQILDTPREAEFDDVTKLVSEICDTPIAVVNLITRGRQWFKSEVGLGVRETPLDSSICAHAILQEGLVVVPDTTKDSRFADNPLVTGDPRLRFYAGSLLQTPDGFSIGTLCVLDTEPRELTEHQAAALETLSRHVMNLFELRRTTRRQIELNRQVEAMLEGHKRVLAMVSHDIRGPLGTIAMGSEMLMRQAPAGTHNVTAERISRAAKRAAKLADDLIDVEGLARGSLALERVPTPLSAVIDDVVDQYQPAAQRAGVELDARVVRPLAPVSGDAARLAQVLSNLISNAITHTPAGGTVRVEACSDGAAVVMSVRDSGPGVPAEFADKVFEPFWRGREDASTKGLGLGLSIVQELVHAHEGTVALKDNDGSGAHFEVRLPALAER